MSQEADLVDRLRGSCRLVSLVAVSADRIVGHILFTPAVIEGEERFLNGMGLAPIAVLPELQRSGIGSAFMRAGLAEILAYGEPFVIVLGHPITTRGSVSFPHRVWASVVNMTVCPTRPS